MKSLAGSFRKIQDESGSYEGGGKIKGAGLKAAATESKSTSRRTKTLWF